MFTTTKNEKIECARLTFKVGETLDLVANVASLIKSGMSPYIATGFSQCKIFILQNSVRF